MDKYGRCRIFRRMFMVTLVCCSVTCYTWHVLSSYPLLSTDDHVIDVTSPLRHQDFFEQAKSSPEDYSVRVWLPRRIKSGSPMEIPSRTRPDGDTKPGPIIHGPQGDAKSSSASDVKSRLIQKPLVEDSRLLPDNSSGMVRLWGGGGAQKRLPQALIIGVKKCGTRALLEFLRLHPDIRATGPETHFFDRFYDRGLEWYRQQMPQSLESQITMEKTPSYFITREVPQRLHRMSPAVKLVVVVRDPVTRAISDYTQTASKRPAASPSFDAMTFRNSSTGLVDTSWSAIRIGVYSRFLEWWIKFFHMNQIHFVSGENLIKDPAGEMALVQDFLGLKRVITDKHFYFNETKGFPCLKKSEGNGNPHCLGKTKGRTHPDISSSTITRLRDFYRPFNLKFYQMVGRDFGWM